MGLPFSVATYCPRPQIAISAGPSLSTLNVVVNCGAAAFSSFGCSIHRAPLKSSFALFAFAAMATAATATIIILFI